MSLPKFPVPPVKLVRGHDVTSHALLWIIIPTIIEIIELLFVAFENRNAWTQISGKLNKSDSTCFLLSYVLFSVQNVKISITY